MVRPSPHPVFAAERAARRAAARVQDRNAAYYAARPQEIEARLAQLDEEMDVERAMDVYALRASVAGGALSVLRSRSWVLISLAAAAMLALQRPRAIPLCAGCCAASATARPPKSRRKRMR